jgi:CO dehydrogenase maturation factor
MKIDKKPLVVSVVGKGGTGKTAITTLIAKVLAKNYNLKLLLVDADTAHPHLSNMVKLNPEKSLENLRMEVVKKISSGEEGNEELAENIDYYVYNTIAESKDFSLFSIGQPEGPGCFCPSNNLLRNVIESISKDFDLVLIDCEAGLEQINRLVIKSIDILLIVVDISLRSVETAKSIREMAKRFTGYQKMGVIINKVRGNIGTLEKKIRELDFQIVGKIEDDEIIRDFDLEGKPLIDIEDNSPNVKKVKKILEYFIFN